ncbi:hypothetical protein AB1Y20_002274 [Prymnesium parvum]|uniref:Guanylate cyclase domain-containing protein n=1 Tax=Prymnesium parvum TaxID=97485 RepID=A0AB34JAN0_PRYPA
MEIISESAWCLHFGTAAEGKATPQGASNAHAPPQMAMGEDASRNLRLFSSYSPAQVVLRYASQEQPQPPTEPEHYSFLAAVGFVDVSGFTALSEKLNKDHGRKGAELLNQYINSYFELLISGIADHGGDVIKFAGDALQVVWRAQSPSHGLELPSSLSNSARSSQTSFGSMVPNEHAALEAPAAAHSRSADAHSRSAERSRELPPLPLHRSRMASSGRLPFRPMRSQSSVHHEPHELDGLARLVAQASHCCLDLLANLNEYSPVDGVVLRLHMGVGAGELSEFYVGGYAGKWEYFVAGEPIEQMSDATEEATHGQLVLSRPAYEALRSRSDPLLKPQLVGTELPSGQFLLSDLIESAPSRSRLRAIKPGRRKSSERNSMPNMHAWHVFPMPKRARSASREGRSAASIKPLMSRSILSSIAASPMHEDLEKVLRCFVPALIEERVQGGQTGTWAAEHRKLVSVFMKILGLGVKPCEVSDVHKAHLAVRAVQEQVARFDGTITRLICDDKGTRFLIAFGLPGHANEDDEGRAVLSSLEVLRALSTIDAHETQLTGSSARIEEDIAQTPEQNERLLSPRRSSLGCAIGITTGRVFCGEAGSETRREYTLAGAKVNLAARLMQAWLLLTAR